MFGRAPRPLSHAQCLLCGLGFVVVDTGYWLSFFILVVVYTGGCLHWLLVVVYTGYRLSFILVVVYTGYWLLFILVGSGVSSSSRPSAPPPPAPAMPGLGFRVWSCGLSVDHFICFYELIMLSDFS